MKFSTQNYILSGVTVSVLVLGFLVGGVPAEDRDRISHSEKAAVKKLYEKVKGSLTKEIEHGERFLVRWIRAKNNDLKAAEAMLRKHLQWRKEYKMDNILNEDFEGWKRRTSIGFSYDHDGRPAITTGLGQIDVRRIVLAREQEHLDRFIVYAYENTMYEITNAKNKTFMDGYLLFDMVGYASRTHACLACISSWVNLVNNYENHYPQYARNFFVVNVPRIFQYLVDNFLRPVMSRHTEKGLKLFGYDKEEWRQELLKIFPQSELPQIFGGSLRAAHPLSHKYEATNSTKSA